MRLFLFLALLLPLAACSDSEGAEADSVAVLPEADPADPAPVDTLDADSADPVSAQPPAADEEGPVGYDEMAYRVQSAQSGDAACYLELAPESGGEANRYTASFEVCEQIEADGLTGRLVTFQMEEGEIMAASCEGDPDCTDRETVQTVTGITVVRVE